MSVETPNTPISELVQMSIYAGVEQVRDFLKLEFHAMNLVN